MLLSLSLLNQWSATALAVAHKTAKAVLLQLLLKFPCSARLVYFYRSQALRGNDIRHSLFHVKLIVSRLMLWSATALAVAHKTAKAVLLQLRLKFLCSVRLVYL